MESDTFLAETKLPKIVDLKDPIVQTESMQMSQRFPKLGQVQKKEFSIQTPNIMQLIENDNHEFYIPIVNHNIKIDLNKLKDKPFRKRPED